jgi:uncharacterized C2H2 Zn-finger protein
MTRECERCHYTTDTNKQYILHLNRKHQCKPIFSNKSCKDIIEEFNIAQQEIIAKRIHKCKDCNKSYSLDKYLIRHIKENHPSTFRLYTLLSYLKTKREQGITNDELDEAQLLLNEYKDPYPEPNVFELLSPVSLKIMDLSMKYM